MSTKIFSRRLLQTTSRLLSTRTPSPIISSAAANVFRGFASVATSEAATREAVKPRIKTFEIYRWNPDTPQKKPEMVKYDIDLNQIVGHTLCF